MIIFVAINKNWVWSKRFDDICRRNKIKCKVIEPGNGRINLLLANLHAFFLYLLRRICRQPVRVAVCFGSTNGYVWSYLSPGNFDLFLLGTDCLSDRKSIRLRSKRACEKARNIYISSPEHLIANLFGDEINKKIRNNGTWWSPSKDDFSQANTILHNTDNSSLRSLSVTTLRHLRKSYLWEESLRLIEDLSGKLEISEVRILNSKPDKCILIPKTLASCQVQIVNSMPRLEFIKYLTGVDIGISLTVTDFFGGPIVEAACAGCVVIVNSDHPILSYIDKDISIISVSKLHVVPQHLSRGKLKRALSAQDLFCTDGFSAQVKDLLGSDIMQ